MAIRFHFFLVALSLHSLLAQEGPPRAQVQIGVGMSRTMSGEWREVPGPPMGPSNNLSMDLGTQATGELGLSVQVRPDLALRGHLLSARDGEFKLQGLGLDAQWRPFPRFPRLAVVGGAGFAAVEGSLEVRPSRWAFGPGNAQVLEDPGDYRKLDARVPYLRAGAALRMKPWLWAEGLVLVARLPHGHGASESTDATVRLLMLRLSLRFPTR